MLRYMQSHTRNVLSHKKPEHATQVPVAIGGPGLPEGVGFRRDLKEPGLANVGPTIINLLGFEAPKNMVPSLLA